VDSFTIAVVIGIVFVLAIFAGLVVIDRGPAPARDPKARDSP
jgi:hypothetical protein